MTAENRSCEDWRQQLDDYVDDRLPPDSARALRRHLDECSECSSAVAEIESLVAQAAELSAALEPPRDLWPGVEARLAPRARRRGVEHWIPRTIAAALLIAFGAFSSRILWPPPPAGIEIAEEAPADPVMLARAQLATAEAEYLRVKEALWLTIYRNHEDLSPMTVSVVEHNLRTIDKATRDIRRALEEDPGNQRLEGQLFAQSSAGDRPAPPLGHDDERDLGARP